MSYATEILRRVYGDNEGVYVEVRPCPDNPDECIEIHTPTEKSQKYYGAFRISLPKELVRQLGAALIASASE